MGLKIDGLEEFRDIFKKINEDYLEEKKEELEIISTIAESEIKLVTPVKKGVLRRSITHEIINPSTSEVGPGAEAPYAQAVNDGHITSNGGFVKGQHYMEKGLQNAEPKIIEHIDNWMSNFMRKVGE